jgi:serine/threonine protein kinase
MSTPSTPDERLSKLLLGHLPPEEAERLSATFADDSRVVPVAESLGDDTLLAAIQGNGTQADSSDPMTDRLVDRLKADMTSTTRTSEGNPGVRPGDEMPARLEYFTLERELGQGGMGTVYLARDTRLNRAVAIKTLKSDLARKPAAKDRFLREARVAAALEHECVVPIYYVGEDDGIPFLAMPLLKGRGLDHHLKANGGSLPVADVLRIAAQVAGGLAAAHAVGLIHRDVKPSNLWVDADGRRVRVLDFGLARYETDESNLTASGIIVGTPAYMAPEQARGRAVDARADLFSLGVVMYQMLTGVRPFTGPDTVAILSSLALDTPPAPRELRPDVPAELSALVMGLLDKEPQNRPASADVVRVAVERMAGPTTDDRTDLDFTPPDKLATPRLKPKTAPAPTPKTATAASRKPPLDVRF